MSDTDPYASAMPEPSQCHQVNVRSVREEVVTALEQLAAETSRTPLGEVSRRAEHARLLISYVSGDKDVQELGLDRQRLDAMLDQRFPLAFDSNTQFAQFYADMSSVLQLAGISGTIRIIGTSTSLFSLNPSKPSSHYFDDESKGSADLDIGIESPELRSLMLSHGVTPAESKLSPSGSFKEYDLRANVPGLVDVLDQWAFRLGRVIHIGAPGDGAPLDPSSPTDFRLPLRAG